MALTAVANQPAEKPLSVHAQSAIKGNDSLLSHSWTPVTMRAALDEHETGRFTSSAALADSFGRHAHTSGVVQSRVEAALGLPYSTDYSEDTTNRQRAIQHAYSVDCWWFTAFPEAQLSEVLYWRILLGFYLGAIQKQEIILPNGGREWRPFRMHTVHPSRVSYQATAFGGEPPGWYVNGADGNRFRVTPGDGEWFLTTAGGSRPWMKGLVRPLANEWLAATYAGRDWNRSLEVRGMGVRKAIVPMGADPTHVAQFRDRVSRLGVETTLVLPRKAKDDGYDFEIAAVDIQETQGFLARINHSEMAMSICTLGNNLTTKIDGGGSYAAATVAKGEKNERIKADVGGLSTDCREQIVKPWGRENYADWRDEHAPWNRWDATPAEQMQPKAQKLLTLSQALVGLMKLGVNILPILEAFGLEQDPDAEVNLDDPATEPTPPDDPTKETEKNAD